LQSKRRGTRFQCAGGEKTLGFFAADEDEDDGRARFVGVGGTVIDVERGRERRVGVGSLAERVMENEGDSKSLEQRRSVFRWQDS